MGFSAYRQSGLTHNDGEGTYDGYTLITPQGGSETLLLNMEGRIVHGLGVHGHPAGLWSIAGQRQPAASGRRA